MNSTEKYYKLLKDIENNQRLIEHDQLRSLVQPKSIFYKLIKGKAMKVFLSSAMIASIGAMWFFGLFEKDRPEHNFENEISSSTKKEAVITIGTKQIQFPADAIPVLHLNKQELENIGITETEEGYEFITESRLVAESNIIKAKHHGYPDVSDEAIMKRKNFLDKSTSKTSDAIMDYAGWDQSKIDMSLPVSLNSYDFRGSSHSCSFGFVPVMSRNAAYVFYNKDHNKLHKYLVNNKIKLSEVNYIELDQKTELIQNAVLLYLPTEDKQTYLTYLPSKELVEKLPERYRALIIQSMDIYKDYDKVPERRKEPKMTQIGGIRSIELNNDELSRININKEDEAFRLIVKTEYNTKDYTKEQKDKFNKKLERYKYTVSDSGLYYIQYTFSKSEDMEYEILENSNYNVNNTIVMYSEIRRYYSYDEEYDYWETASSSTTLTFDGYSDKYSYSYKEDKYVLNSDKIIPVTIVLGDTNETLKSKYDVKTIDLWFKLDEDFVSQLPDRYKNPLSKELHYSDLLNSGEMTSDEICEALAGEDQYLNLCEKQSDNIEISSIYPNPVTNNKIYIEFACNDVNLNIDLYRFNGELVQNLYSSKGKLSGYNKMDFNLKAQPGVYLVYFTTDKEDVISRKIIIK